MNEASDRYIFGRSYKCFYCPSSHVKFIAARLPYTIYMCDDHEQALERKMRMKESIVFELVYEENS